MRSRRFSPGVRVVLTNRETQPVPKYDMFLVEWEATALCRRTRGPIADNSCGRVLHSQAVRPGGWPPQLYLERARQPEIPFVNGITMEVTPEQLVTRPSIKLIDRT